MKTAYILQSFPQTSETFIINEIRALQHRHSDMRTAVFSLKRPVTPAPHTTVGDIHVQYIREQHISLCTLLRVLCTAICTRPIQTIKVLWYFARVPRGNFFVYYLIRYWISLIMLFRLTCLLKKISVDHMHAHFGNNPAQYAMCASLLTGIPYSFTTHARDLFVHRELISQKHRYAAFAVTISEFNKRYIIDKYGVLSPHKIHVIHCGIDTGFFAMKQYTDSGSSLFRIVSIGRLVEKKGFADLIAACELLKERIGSRFSCSIIGNGPLYDELQGEINLRYLHETVKLLGVMPQSDVQRLLNDADLFVLPCVQARDGDMDGSPMVLKEAMATGVVCISTHLSGIPELMGDAGILVNPCDPNGLFEAIMRVYTMDTTEKKRIGERERSIIETKFNVNDQSDRLYELFEESAKKYRPT